MPTQDFVVNTQKDRDQAQPDFTALEDGRFVAVWLSDQGGPRYEVHGQLFNGDGTPFGSEFTLNAPTENSPSGPKVAALGNDQFVATWYVKTSGDDWNIVGRTFSADGSPAGGEFTVNSTTEGFQAEPDIAVLEGGRFAVTWYSVTDEAGAEARVRVFNADGSAGPDFAAPLGSTWAGGRPAILALRDGQFVVAWTSFNNTRSPEVQARMFHADGSPADDDFTINGSGHDVQALPRMAALADGGFVVTWTSQESADAGFDIRARIYHADGTPVGADFLVNTTQMGYQAVPDVVKLSDGRFVITWESLEGDPANYDIRGRLFDPDGTPQGNDFLVNATTAGDQYQQSAAALDGNRIISGWQSRETANGDFDIRAVILPFDSDNTPPVIVAPGDADGLPVTIMMAENTAEVATIEAIDADQGQALTYSIAGGADAALFSIDLHTGALDFIRAPDFETPVDQVADNIYDVVVEVSDPLGASDQRTISVHVINQPGITATAQGAVLAGSNEEDLLVGRSRVNTQLLGRGGNDRLIGGDGNDRLDGGAGSDTLSGRGGNDSYWIDNSADVIIEAKQGGIDTVHSSIDYVLGSYAENLALEGDAFAGIGNKFDNMITGSDGNNLLSALIGRDRLEGGYGDDTLIGGRDCDTFVFKPGFGHDVVADFAVSGAYSAVGPNHDVIEFDKSIFANAEAVFSHSVDKVYGLVITDSQGDTLTLYGVDLTKLQAHPEDLHFV